MRSVQTHSRLLADEGSQTPLTGHRKKEGVSDAIVPPLLGTSLLMTHDAQHGLLEGRVRCVHTVCLESVSEDPG